jgi:hypothetical protein
VVHTCVSLWGVWNIKNSSHVLQNAILAIVLHVINLSYDLARCRGAVWVSNDNEYSQWCVQSTLEVWSKMFKINCRRSWWSRRVLKTFEWLGNWLRCVYRLVKDIMMLFEEDWGSSSLIKMLKKYCELNNVVQGWSEHYVDLLSAIWKVPVYFLSTMCKVGISAWQKLNSHQWCYNHKVCLSRWIKLTQFLISYFLWGRQEPGVLPVMAGTKKSPSTVQHWCDPELSEWRKTNKQTNSRKSVCEFRRRVLMQALIMFLTSNLLLANFLISS